MSREPSQKDMSATDALAERVTLWKQAVEGGGLYATAIADLRIAVVDGVRRHIGMGLVRNEYPQKYLKPILDDLEDGIDTVFAEGGQAGCFAAFLLAKHTAMRFESLEFEKRILALEGKKM
jgi:hypothetical protein